AHLAPPAPRPWRARGRGDRGLLRPSARRAAPAGGAPRPVAAARMPSRLGRKRERRRFRRLLVGRRRGAAARGRELRSPPGSVLRPIAVRGAGPTPVAAPGPDRLRHVRAGRRRPRGARALPRRARLAGLGVLDGSRGLSFADTVTCLAAQARRWW